MSSEYPTLQSIERLLSAGKTTSQELTLRCLERARDPDGEGSRVYTRVFDQQALSAAKASDQLRAAGLVRSPLEGIPIAIKDLFDVQGYTTRAASIVLNDAPVAERDAAIVSYLRQAGAVIIGSTNMSEFAFSGLGLNPHYGTPRNPWDRQSGRIPGGSSSGSAVAVTDSMAIAAIGTDTGGSVRIPAALCGLTGFKPTAKRLNASGALPLSTTLDSIGPMAASVTCCVILDAIMANQPVTLPRPVQPTRLVLGLPKQLFFEGMDEHVAQSFAVAQEKLARAGVRFVEIDLPELAELPAINQAGGFTAAESWAWHESLLKRRRSEYDPRVAVRIQRGSEQSAADYIRLLSARARWIEQVQQKLVGIDALIAPTVPRIAPAIAPLESDDELFMATNMFMLRNPSVINFLDGCSLSLPCHTQGTAPVGLMLSHTAGHDAHLLSVGLSCEAILKTQS